MIGLEPDLKWYVAGVTLLALLTHGLIRRFAVACPLAAALAALANFAMSVVANPGFKPGWAIPVAVVGFVVALPISFAVGMIIQATRSRSGPGWGDRAAMRPGPSPGALLEQEPLP